MLKINTEAGFKEKLKHQPSRGLTTNDDSLISKFRPKAHQARQNHFYNRNLNRKKLFDQIFRKERILELRLGMISKS